VRVRLTDPDADARKIDADALCERCGRRETRQHGNTCEHGQPFLHGISPFFASTDNAREGCGVPMFLPMFPPEPMERGSIRVAVL
jgi:hypothetical protein